MTRHLSLIFLLLVFPAGALAEGFGTPTMDGLLTGDEAIYGTAEASDGVDPPQGFTNLDLGDLYVANDDNFWYFLFTVNADVSTKDWGKYLLFIDTTNDANGGTTDAWGRNIIVNDPHKAEFSIRSWIDGGGGYSAAKTQFWEWDQGGMAWSENGTAAEAALATGTVSGLEWKIERSKLGDPSELWCEVATTGGTSTDNAQDTANDPAQDWNAVDWSTTADLDNSTHVARSTGTDTTPPTVIGGCAQDIGDGFSDTVEIVFSEPVDPTTATNAANYTDLGGRSVFSPTLTGPNTVEILVQPVYTFGNCHQIRVANVQDVAGNPIVDDGTTNVLNWYGFQLHLRGHMAIHMQEHDVPPHTFALEGSESPLTWEPLCDFPLADGDGDSVYTGDVTFCLPCSTSGSGAEVTTLEFKFSHQCTEWEPLAGNHFYEINLDSVPAGVDTFDVNWADQAAEDFTEIPVDVIFRVQAPASGPPFATGDSLGIGGAELPLDWNVPPVNLLADDGIAPDDTADDGIYAARIQFPTGTLKNVEYKFLLRSMADTAFAFECEAMGNRSVFLDDTIFSDTNPIDLPAVYFDDCLNVTAIGDLLTGAEGLLLEPARPNPTRGETELSFTVPERGWVRLNVYDVTGRLVERLVNGVTPEGRHVVRWAARRADGTPLPSGVYFTRVVVGAESATRKVILLN